MKKTIYKYELIFKELDSVTKELPINSEILSAQLQNEVITIWVLLNPNEKETKMHFFELFGTGHEIGCNIAISRKFLNTLQFANGLVFHLFERFS